MPETNWADNGSMAYLLRIELPDEPGALGAVATALGDAGADIAAIEVVEHRSDGRAVDDVLLDLPPTELPDKLVTACHTVDGVRVHWVSRYAAGGNLRMDLEVVEAMTANPRKAVESLAQALPQTFRADWGMALARDGDDVRILTSTAAAPAYAEAMRAWVDIDGPTTLSNVEEWRSTVFAAAPVTDKGVVMVLGRHGGPDVLDSELARLGHLAGLAATISAGSRPSA